VVTLEKSLIQFKFENPVNYNVRVKVFNAQSKEKINGLLDVYDSTGSRLIGHIETFKNYGLALFTEYKGNVIFDLDFLGFNSLERNINFNQLLAKNSNNLISINSDSIDISFKLEPEINLEKYQALDKIYFYEDASVLKPESKYQLDQLVGLLNRYLALYINVHGYTNGNSGGKIIPFDLTRKNHFQILRDVDSFRGSAKKLSQLRAITVKDYLVTNGVNPQRIKTYGWGGAQPIYPKKSVKAYKNLRAEIELYSSQQND